jgi:hypothetical protein
MKPFFQKEYEQQGTEPVPGSSGAPTEEAKTADTRVISWFLKQANPARISRASPVAKRPRRKLPFYPGIYETIPEVCFILAARVRIRFNSSITGCREGGITVSSVFTVLLW